ncbi:hypothetical protein JXM67_09070 [candidate division WOR-3 bacterium]|nr:hypothetical protein [candidate division WOR-3 bacterium]
MVEKPYPENTGALTKRISTGMVVEKTTALKAYLILLALVHFSCILSPFQKVGIVRVSKFFAEVYYADHPFSEEEMKEWCMQRAEEILEKNNRLFSVSIIVLYDRRAARYFTRPKNFSALTTVGDAASFLFTDTVYIKRKTEGGGSLIMFNDNYSDNETHWLFMQRKEIKNPEEIVQ